MDNEPNGLKQLADRHGISLDAVRHLIRALEAGQGTMAQFNHPDLGGFGQWSQGGMTMIGDMFNTGLKARVEALCSDLARSLPPAGWSTGRGGVPPASWWPGDLGQPSTSGSQNGMRYAYFPAARRLAVESEGAITVYDTGDHDISGVSQQQGSSPSLRFAGRGGPIDLDGLKRVEHPGAVEAAPRPFEPEPLTPVHPTHGDTPPPPGGGDVLITIERLSELHRKGVLTEAEFSGKKAELLARL